MSRGDLVCTSFPFVSRWYAGRIVGQLIMPGSTGADKALIVTMHSGTAHNDMSIVPLDKMRPPAPPGTKQVCGYLAASGLVLERVHLCVPCRLVLRFR